MSKEIKDKIRQKLISGSASLLARDEVDPQELRQQIAGALEQVLRSERMTLTDAEKKKIIEEAASEFIGYGVLEPLLNDPQVTEIMVNGPKKVYVEKAGKRELSNITFESDSRLMALIYRMLALKRRHVDEAYPYTEIALRDGSRVNIIIPPLALNGPTITIRKFIREIKTVDDLISLGTMDKRMGDFLIACVKAKINIIFSGATGAGKTTTLNVLSNYINNDERVITIEDTAELRLEQEHVVRLESRQPGIEGKGEIGIRDLFKNSLRMRPDRIIIGEIRGSEALDMLQAICSGHRGSLAVLHANTPQDVIYRLETMILASGIAMGLATIHRQIAAAVNLIVQEEQLVDGTRKITHITQVNGLKDGEVVLEDIFLYEMSNIDAQGKVRGIWKATGVIPAFYPLFKKYGVVLSKETFNKD